MKAGCFAVLTLCLGFAQGAFADQPRPRKVPVRMEKFFVPTGFDDNDNAQFVIHGEFPNTCYRAAAPKVDVNRRSRVITVTAQAYLYSGCFCAEVLVPFSQPIDLGILDAGRYRLVELDPRGRVVGESALHVARARSSAPDEFMYAPVRQVELDTSGAAVELVLKGVFPDDCMSWDEVRVVHRVADVVEVLPIVRYDSQRRCARDPRPFERRVPIQARLEGEVLFHVRALNGQAVNRVERF